MRSGASPSGPGEWRLCAAVHLGVRGAVAAELMAGGGEVFWRLVLGECGACLLC